jgi:glycosyltransferase involved in cell wall biosynthesis
VGPRLAVIVPCFNNADLAQEALASIREAEPLELVVVDDASTDPHTRELLGRMDAGGVRVVRADRNGGAAASRMLGLARTTAPYVASIDADDHAVPGAFGAMVDRLEEDRGAAACVADYEEFGSSDALRAVPERLDPYRVALTNEYPMTCVFRRSALERAGGWHEPHPAKRGYEDWDLWMTLAERGERIVHLGAGRPAYRHRLHAPGVNSAARREHAAIYRAMRARHPELFGRLGEHRRRSDLSILRRLLYPVVYGERRVMMGVARIKPWLDRLGWTTRRRAA